MRAREFTINIPITIKINGDGDPEVDMADDEPVDPSIPKPKPIMVPHCNNRLNYKSLDKVSSAP